MQAAARLVGEHHSAQRGSSMGKDGAKSDWLCKSCKGSDGKPFRNRGTRTECFKCHIGKGACFAGAVQAGNVGGAARPARANDGPKAAEIVAKQALQQKRAMQQQHIAELKELRGELAALREQAKAVEAGKPAATPAAVVGMDVDVEQQACAALDEAVTAAKLALDDFKGLSGGVRACIPNFEVQLRARQEAYDSALESRRSANPLKQQLAVAESWHSRASKRLLAAKSALEAKQKQFTELQAEIDKQKESI